MGFMSTPMDYMMPNVGNSFGEYSHSPRIYLDDEYPSQKPRWPRSWSRPRSASCSACAPAERTPSVGRVRVPQGLEYAITDPAKGFLGTLSLALAGSTATHVLLFVMIMCGCAGVQVYVQ